MPDPHQLSHMVIMYVALYDLSGQRSALRHTRKCANEYDLNFVGTLEENVFEGVFGLDEILLSARVVCETWIFSEHLPASIQFCAVLLGAVRVYAAQFECARIFVVCHNVIHVCTPSTPRCAQISTNEHDPNFVVASKENFV